MSLLSAHSKKWSPNAMRHPGNTDQEWAMTVSWPVPDRTCIPLSLACSLTSWLPLLPTPPEPVPQPHRRLCWAREQRQGRREGPLCQVSAHRQSRCRNPCEERPQAKGDPGEREILGERDPRDRDNRERDPRERDPGERDETIGRETPGRERPQGERPRDNRERERVTPGREMLWEAKEIQPSSYLSCPSLSCQGSQFIT